MANIASFAHETDEWNATLDGDYLWSNVNFGEAVTEAMTPLAWSIIRFTLGDWVFVPGVATVGNIAGRPYLNISAFATVLSALGRGRDDLLRTMEATLYVKLPEEMEIPLIPLSGGARLASLANGLRVQAKRSAGVRRVGAYLATGPAWFERNRAQVRACDRAGLSALWRDEISPHVKQGVWSVLGIAMHSANYTMQLRRELTDLVGADDASSLIANVGAGAGLASLGPMIGLAKVAAGEMTRDAYLQAYGHRGPHEFELSVPRPAEDPSWLDRELAGLRAAPVTVYALLAKQRDAFDAAWTRFRSRYPQKADATARRIAESAQRARLRELARSQYVRDRWMIRLFALRTGELTGLGDDVFFLTLDEMLGLLIADETPIAAISARKAAYLRHKMLPSCPSVIRGPFDPFQWAADENRRSDIFDGRATSGSGVSGHSRAGVITGSPGSAGRVQGTVRCLASPDEMHQLRQGEVLVAVQTDIAWTVVFPRAAAVVTDVGAPLSHAAIVARELGIPAVVGCGDATARLKTGDRVQVDGGAGTVTLIHHT
ncbi:MAG TPA: PEP-utilizing enzyme [Anaerolineae bacterium]|nr:PEP-utilizing enzyme [Anaerolineae bacterium]